MGHAATLGEGDGYLIRQGSRIRWEVRCARAQRSFLNRTQPTGAAAPMTIYRAGSALAQSELADLGDPAGLGGTVLAGHPAICAREAGDSYLIRQAGSVLWQVGGARVQKSFPHVVER